MSVSELEALLEEQLADLGITDYEREYRFHPVRRWRFDFAWTTRMLAVEVDGATWAGGRHNTGAGFAKDCEKMNTAVLMGWGVLRFDSPMIKNGIAIEVIQEALTLFPSAPLLKAVA